MGNNDLSRISGTVFANYGDPSRPPHPPYRQGTHPPAFQAPPQLPDPPTPSDPPRHSGLVPWSSNTVPSAFIPLRDEARHATCPYSTYPGDFGPFQNANRPAPHLPVGQPTSFHTIGTTVDQFLGYGIDPKVLGGHSILSGGTDFSNQPYHALSHVASLANAGAPFPTAAFAPPGIYEPPGVPSPPNLPATPSTYTPSTYTPSTYTPSTYTPSTYAPSTYAPYAPGIDNSPGGASLYFGTGHEIVTFPAHRTRPHTSARAETMPTRKRNSTAVDPPASSPAVPSPKRRRRTSGGAAVRPSKSDPAAAAAEAESDNESDIIDLRDLSKVPELLLQRKREKDERIKLGRFQCAICMDYATSVTVTHCGHLFCVDCLTTALDTESQRHKCPICRQKIENKPRGAYKSNTKGFWPLELKLMTARKGDKGKTADG